MNQTMRNFLFEAVAKARSRTSWNDRLVHWERPASDTEEAQIERAATMVRNALSNSKWLVDEGVIVEPQGSYYNNTNIRQNVDQDLRAVHPAIYVEHASGLSWQTTVSYLKTHDTGRQFSNIANTMRAEIDNALALRFGILSLDMTGNKATRVLALSGSRAPVDVVPSFKYVWVSSNGLGAISHAEGIAILSKDGSWTHNFPAQHKANGITKRASTQHRFKKTVRSLKRLRDELTNTKQITSKHAPSFLIECLVYAVEDSYFTATAADERYDRLLQVVERIEDLLANVHWVQTATEINGIKYLFRPQQPWSVQNAREFIRAAHTRLLAD